MKTKTISNIRTIHPKTYPCIHCKKRQGRLFMVGLPSGAPSNVCLWCEAARMRESSDVQPRKGADHEASPTRHLLDDH